MLKNRKKYKINAKILHYSLDIMDDIKIMIWELWMLVREWKFWWAKKSIEYLMSYFINNINSHAGYIDYETEHIKHFLIIVRELYNKWVELETKDMLDKEKSKEYLKEILCKLVDKNI